MLNQEEYVRMHELTNERQTNRWVAEELGYHPATIARWLDEDGLPIPVAPARQWRRLTGRLSELPAGVVVARDR